MSVKLCGSQRKVVKSLEKGAISNGAFRHFAPNDQLKIY